ncbi:hypothetical protein FG386_003568 [Cryptosporidium ryanae]|uniref:uncharacterized protein n=1 Tax=Cryptosporidium ryanae TaxID=515981 RepID=UPI003519E218|nr:hypothetical protein FG386_003568 [Cryptosporidium ryanae]
MQIGVEILLNKIKDYRDILFKILFLVLYLLCGYHFGLPGLIILTIIGLFINTSSKNKDSGELSAYNILNPGKTIIR